LQDGFHGCNSSAIVSVDFHHFDEILMSIEAVDEIWDERHQIAKDRESVDLKLLELWWLPSVHLRIARMWIKVHHDAVEEVLIHDLLMSLGTFSIST